MKITIGSRGSKLALWQAQWVKGRLSAAGHQVDIQIIKTSGDKLQSIPLTSGGTKGLFIKEIEDALLAGRVQLAVHSMKDLPVDQPQGLMVGAVPERADARDVLITRDGKKFADLPSGARIGTSSLRRSSQLLALRRDISIVPIRGNVDTRLAKLERGEFDAIGLAAAGLTRLGFASRITQYFSVDEICPAVGQGALAIEIRRDDAGAARAIAPLDHATTHRAVIAERAMLRHLGGGCAVPIAAHATVHDSQLRLVGVVASIDGARVLRAVSSAPVADAKQLGEIVAADLLKRGAAEILK